MVLNIIAGWFCCHHRRRTRSRKLLLGINDAGAHWHSISLLSSPLYCMASSTCYTFFSSFFVLFSKLLTSLSYLLTVFSMLAIFVCISLSWDSIILSSLSFPPCWELRFEYFVTFGSRSFFRPENLCTLWMMTMKTMTMKMMVYPSL